MAIDLEHRQLIVRPRRLRRNANIRGLVRETRVTLDDLIMPVFITVGKNKKHEISSMPGIYQWSLDKVGHHIADLMNAGITRVILFGIPGEKDATGSDSYNENGIIQQAIRFLRKNFPDLYIITDVCMCEYTDHGHCGIIHENDVHNDTTLGYLEKQALSHAAAGVDMVAPSGMMDGAIETIRLALDEYDFENIPIMSYAVKYASSYYGPFREAAESAPQFGDRQAYQMDPANVREGLKEAELDIAEGADIIMVKPALAYLDVIARVKEMTSLPVACYNVSGEYSMIKAAAAKGWIDGTKVMLETLTSMKRAGADIILTYFALEAAKFLK
ncbi:MAG: delta-aminolevulinic acid dehydratase [Candidatus Marinimicrobia bacterium CG1_02_48_14]|nr:MAG: delta-aminolevulinic acid dehydratase [Candidatus Marinimicrobia bacterium CG1_02_48_14]